MRCGHRMRVPRESVEEIVPASSRQAGQAGASRGQVNYAASKGGINGLTRALADAGKIKALEADMKAAQDEARKFVVPNEYSQIVEREGASGLNASTNFDQTQYLYSFPSNKLELWAYMESERFLDPVLREFHTEKKVIAEERRMGVESQPVGRMMEEFLAEAVKSFSRKVRMKPLVETSRDV